MQTPLTIGMVVFPNLTQLDFTAPHEVFSRLRDVRISLIAQSLEPIHSDAGLTFSPDATLADAPAPDILFVPGGAGVNVLMEDTAFLDGVRRLGENARCVTAVCTGSLLLAAAGLLDGYRATTHWLSLDLLPIFGVEAVSERVVIDRNRMTGGGVTAGIDLALAVAAQVYGDATAKAIQLSIEYDPQPPFASGSPRVADPALVESMRQVRSEFQAARRAIAERAAQNLRQRRAPNG